MELNSYNNIKDYREERRYSVPHGPSIHHHNNIPAAASEDLHAWSIYRQNLNSDFTDSALGSSDKSPLPYGNFQLRDTTVQSILSHPRYGPKSALGSNMYTYLKFGLPRVFPPGSQRSNKLAPAAGQRGRVNRGFRDVHTAGSSGYESSDNETGRAPQNLRKFRSESDFRNISIGATIQHKNPHSRPVSRLHGNMPAALKQPNSRASIAGTHLINHYAPQHSGNIRTRQNRSHSEADLLSNGNIGTEIIYDYDARIYGDTRQVRSERQSQAVIYPNIQVQQLDVQNGVRGVSIQAKAGDLLSIMATSAEEGTLLIETIAGLRERLGGDIYINGQLMSKKLLKQFIGYVPAPDFASLDPRMSVQNTLSFHAALMGPMDKTDLKERIDILVEDLGLTAVRSANVCRLTHSEKQRLNVACQLLTQCSILVLDKTTKNMDIFDTFFLVEYLRQWCTTSTGRIVMMTLQPPTFEILSMCSKVLLLSGGRTIFSGSRSDLPRQLGSMGYPCPPFKNPADYYLDLVTLDDLSAAALLESSARIESLANAWERISLDGINQPVPIANLPNTIKKASNFGQITTLAKRYMNYKQPGSLLSWISRLIVAAVLSLFIGGIFWDVMSDPQLNLNDRLGYHYSVMTVAIWPIVLMLVQDIQNDRKYAEVDIRLQLYGRTEYILVQILFSILPSAFIWLAFLLPCHSMAGLNFYSNNDSGVYIYMGYMLLYLMVIQTLTLFASHLLPSSKLAATLFTILIVLFISSPAGYLIHNSSTSHLSFLAIISPQKWLLPLLTKDEYSPETLASTTSAIQLCRNKQVQHQEIIVQQACPMPNGTSFLADFRLLSSDHVLNPSDIYSSTLIALFFSIAMLSIFSVIIFFINTKNAFKKSKKF